MRNLKIEDLHYELPTEPVDEENWDMETWRREKPMDYFLAMYLLNTSQNNEVKAEVFKTIYRIVRFYVPDVLYKYYSLSNNETLNMKKFQTLSEGKIYMADIKDFNDPFDGKGFFYDPTQLADIDRLKPHGGKYIDDFTTYIKATSLTANGVQSMPMWAHYASNHTGFCVSYAMEGNLTLQSNTFPVQYTNERLDVTSLMREQAIEACDEIERQTAMGKKEIILDDLTILFMSLLLCNLKHSSWSYEREFRCTTASNGPGMPYIDAKPKEIYIGMNCNPNHAQRLIEIADSWQIPVYKMGFDECRETYELIANKAKQ